MCVVLSAMLALRVPGQPAMAEVDGALEGISEESKRISEELVKEESLDDASHLNSVAEIKEWNLVRNHITFTHLAPRLGYRWWWMSLGNS